MVKVLVLFSCLFLLGCVNRDGKEFRKVNISYTLEADWKFSEQDQDKWYPATVPGVIHQDLLDNHLIEEPYFENNEIDLRWIEEKNWVYTTTIEITESQLENEYLELQFDGLDTYAKVWVNGEKILETNNMFRQWRCNVVDLLAVGENQLSIEFIAPLNQNRKKLEDHPHQLPSGNETVEEKVSPFTRKAAYQFGWDWGPRFVTSGIWRGIHLNAWNNCRINNVYCTTDSMVNDTAWMSVEVNVEATKDRNIALIFDGVNRKYTVQEGENTISYHFSIASPNLWWPNGYGDQHQYQLEIELYDEGHMIERKEQFYGVRTVELINEPDSIGTSFYFLVNGEPLFMKGANYIPQSLFLPQVDSSNYRSIIQRAKKANMNMLRVWGGGIYESDYFYQLCDQNGILVWQDFMFAGSMYPFSNEFNENVLEEVKDNVIRLRNHPSIALWCGNNEIEVAWSNWGWQKQFGYSTEDSTKIWNGYQELFHHQIPDQLMELMPNANYTTTSPLSNWGTPANFNHSSMHYWGVWHGREPFENFHTNVGRFMVEYGFQSFPSIESMKEVITEENLNLSSEVMLNRQKSYIGNGMITKHSEKWFGSATSFEEYVVLSQKTQALALEKAIKAHRLKKGHCMGTLFWQFNDCWQGPSWSILDYKLEEKEAYKTVQKWFQPLVIIPHTKNGITSLNIVSDKLKPTEVELKIYSQKELLSTKNITLSANSVTEVIDNLSLEFPNQPLDELLIQLSQDGKVCFEL